MVEFARRHLEAFLDQHKMASLTRLAALRADANVLQEGILDSLSFVEFMLFLEQRSGRRVDADAVDSLMTLHGIGSFLSDNSATSKLPVS
jgi:acyl carrier protein